MKFKVGDIVKNLKYPTFGIGIVVEIKNNKVYIEWDEDRAPLPYNIDGTVHNEQRIVIITPLEFEML